MIEPKDFEQTFFNTIKNNSIKAVNSKDQRLGVGVPSFRYVKVRCVV